MIDVVDSETRSRMMSGIRGKDTKPELRLRSALWRMGIRYRLHVAGIPGRPDLVFPGRNAVVFVHGCFWHAHEHCRYFKVPASRPEFWKVKLQANRDRDARDVTKLMEENWRVFRVWECAIRHDEAGVARAVAGLLEAGDNSADIRLGSGAAALEISTIHLPLSSEPIEGSQGVPGLRS